MSCNVFVCFGVEYGCHGSICRTGTTCPVPSASLGLTRADRTAESRFHEGGGCFITTLENVGALGDADGSSRAARDDALAVAAALRTARAGGQLVTPGVGRTELGSLDSKIAEANIVQSTTATGNVFSLAVPILVGAHVETGTTVAFEDATNDFENFFGLD